jgi:hypothetical protein
MAYHPLHAAVSFWEEKSVTALHLKSRMAESPRERRSNALRPGVRRVKVLGGFLGRCEICFGSAAKPVRDLTIVEGFASVWWLHQHGCARCNESHCVRPNTSSPPSSTAHLAIDRVLFRRFPHRLAYWRTRARGIGQACRYSYIEKRKCVLYAISHYCLDLPLR